MWVMYVLARAGVSNLFYTTDPVVDGVFKTVILIYTVISTSYVEVDWSLREYALLMQG